MRLSKILEKYLIASCFLLGIAFFIMPQLKYYSLHTGVADLGFFLAGIYKVNDQWAHIFYGHVQPYMYLYGFLFQVFPETYVPFLLLGFQSIFLLLATVLIWKNYGKLAGISMILYTPLWANNLFDFHFDHIAVLILAIFFISCKKRKYSISLLVSFLLCFVKEVYALQAMMCGVYLIIDILNKSDLAGMKNKLLAALLVTGFSFLWFVISVKFLLPFFSDLGETAIESGAFSWLGNGLFEIFTNLLFQPKQVFIELISEPKKFFYIVILFGPFLFISILSPRPLIVALPILLISLLSRTPNYYDYAAHYSAGLIIPIIVSFSESIAKIRDLCYFILKRINFYNISILSNIPNIINFIFIIWIIFFQIAVGFSPISRLFWSDKIWSINYKAYIPSERDAVIRNSITKYIPFDSSIIVSTQNNLNYSPLFLSQNYLIFPGGVLEPHKMTNWNEKSFYNFINYLKGEIPVNFETNLVYSDYVLIDINRPYYLFDKGCDSAYMICRDKVIENEYLNAIRILENNYILLFEYNGFKIYKKFN